jgi:predicted nucleic acid-binding Zn ribbon protein
MKNSKNSKSKPKNKCKHCGKPVPEGYKYCPPVPPSETSPCLAEKYNKDQEYRHKCKQCKKVIPKGVDFCSKKCKRKFDKAFEIAFPESIKILKEEKYKKIESMGITNPDEINRILKALGRQELEGQFRDKHLGQCLLYLQMWKTGDWKKTLSRLALRMGMTVRGIRENYLEGLVAEGIISIARGSASILWSWVGLPEELNQQIKFNGGDK